MSNTVHEALREAAKAIADQGGQLQTTFAKADVEALPALVCAEALVDMHRVVDRLTKILKTVGGSPAGKGKDLPGQSRLFGTN